MKAFFDEYGLVILICVIVVILIGIAILLGRGDDSILKTTLDGIIKDWADSGVKVK